MSSCNPNIVPISAEKNCSGKCRGTCDTGKGIWVLAASEGMAALYEKRQDGALSSLPFIAAAPLVEELRSRLEDAVEDAGCNQLVLVGSPSDLSWMTLSLPPSVIRKVVAEIKYPLLPAWFTSQTGLTQLHQALKTALTS